jgi:hypothetical protein
MVTDYTKPVSRSSAESKWAALISSTRTTKRPFSLLELASLAREAIAETGSLESAAERISLSPRMLKQFLLADRLDSLVKQLVADRKIDSVDAVGYLVLLKPADQRFVAKELAEKRIQTSDLRAIRDQRRIMPGEPISLLVKRVNDTKTKQVYVAEFSVRGGVTKSVVAKRIAIVLGPDLTTDVEIEGPIGRVLLTRKGRDALKLFAKDQRVSLGKALPRLIYQL